MRTSLLVFCLALGLAGFGACSSNPEVKRQKYAKYRQNRVFEYEFSVVWKGIESALVNYKIEERDPEKVSKAEFNKIPERTLETDWIYTRSNDKYVEYKVNGSPRKKYLQTRVKYFIKAERSIGGTRVLVNLQEEVERLDEKGGSEDYEEVHQVDSSRVKGLLDKINLGILGSAP